jgi:hypothetical protein
LGGLNVAENTICKKQTAQEIASGTQLESITINGKSLKAVETLM